MESETRVAYGPVPRGLFDPALDELSWQLLGDRFLLRGEGQHFFHYRKGEGITIERGPGADASEEALWLNGSVYSAIASLNGLLPVHASAVAIGGRVFAFTGPAGAGKSTLTAALGARELPMFCDDTLVLDLAEPRSITCLPGHKRLKLREDALEMTGARREEKVSCTVDKFFALPAAGDVGEPLPLGELIFLEEGSETSIAPILGAARFAKVHEPNSATWLFTETQSGTRAERFAHLGRLAQQIPMARFMRPIARDRFGEGVTLMTEYLRQKLAE
ncbi:MAG: hypothetical protein ABIO80_06540 [Sphingomicrobium sp.]